MSQPDNRNKEGPGASIAAARKQQGLTVVDVARALKLPRTTIENIEAGRFERIAAIYRRGYIKNYARLVDLDPGTLLETLGDAEPEPLRSVLPVSAGGRGLDRFVKFATYALVTTVIVPPLVYFFVQGGARLFEPEGQPDSAPVADVDGGASPDSPGYRERMAEALSVRNDEGGALSASALPVSIRPEAPEAAAADAPAATGEQPESGAQADEVPARLELSLRADSWVEIEDANGQRLEFDLLREGQTRAYGGRPPFRLLLGRGSAVAVSLDGEPVVFDGHDRAGVAEFLLGEPPEVTGSPAEVE